MTLNAFTNKKTENIKFIVNKCAYCNLDVQLVKKTGHLFIQVVCLHCKRTYNVQKQQVFSAREIKNKLQEIKQK